MSKMSFSKSDARPSRVLKQVVLAHFEAVMMCFGGMKNRTMP